MSTVFFKNRHDVGPERSREGSRQHWEEIGFGRPLGETTTTLEFHPDKKQIILHRAKTVENIDEDKACRTKLAAQPVGDIDKLFNYWDTWGWHRVTFYGDPQRPVKHIAALLGFAVVHEA